MARGSTSHVSGGGGGGGGFHAVRSGMSMAPMRSAPMHAATRSYAHAAPMRSSLHVTPRSYPRSMAPMRPSGSATPSGGAHRLGGGGGVMRHGNLAPGHHGGGGGHPGNWRRGRRWGRRGRGGWGGGFISLQSGRVNLLETYIGGPLEIGAWIQISAVDGSAHFESASLSTPLPISSGGTGAANAADARTNLGFTSATVNIGGNNYKIALVP
jgi:hypothetical protein